MKKDRWLAAALCVVLAGVLPAHGATADAAAPYPRCPKQEIFGKGPPCVDLFDALDPSEFSAKDFKAASLPLQDRGHAATAAGLPGADSFFAHIAVHPSGRLYAVGGPGLQVATADADGASWHVASHSAFADALRGIAFVDAKRAFAVGENGKIFRTQDGGEHWEPFNRTFATYKDPQLKDLHFDGAAYGVAFADAEHGVVVGEARLLRTIDGGQQWQRVPVALDHIALQQVRFGDARRGWAVGSSGTVLRTDDAGEHWSAVSLGDGEAHLMDVSFSDATHGCIGGGFKVWCTQDGGQAWQVAEVTLPKGFDTGPSIGITSLAMRDAGHGWFITRDGWIFASNDGGKHWAPWMNVVTAAHGKLGGVELWSLALAKDRVWATGVGGFATPKAGAMSLDSSPLIVSWRL
ncbi:Uncharacterized protein SAMN05216570_3314 [Dyella sp. OK004]|uniref:WD40/YVTN/BNR-like repeat-containing protein n=1 Tax=Dyella sp. OK004 TaxID=1855292 RepID=UPI0008E4712E|nr:YCF48-related protein [Dyella sp. OK004]SFS16463.1 Uncharacterized protein SAMN05216570_3314 [Dyella sp. OK004]